MPNETLAKLHFWLFAIGFHMTFIPMHFLGFLGMPRRIYTYPTGRGWEFWNMVSSIGVIFQAHRYPFFRLERAPILRLRENAPVTIRGTHGRSSGPRPRHRLSTISKHCPWFAAVVPCGT